MAQERRIEEVPFVVVDTETTGVRAQSDRIIEIAAVKVVGGEIVDRFTQLVNPGIAVPRRITEITGITTALLYEEPPMKDVMPRFLEFLGDGVFVAHNLSFDQRFVDAELARLGRRPLANEQLCTLRLARRLLRGLRSKSLGSVADFFGIQIRDRHRALGDAEMTAEALLRFFAQLGFEHGIETLDDLLAFQHLRYNQIKKEPKHLRRLREDVLPALPEGPGVYFMKDSKGQTIYIGKAKSLKARVRSYFNAIEAHPQRTRQLVQKVRDVAWEETGSELAALLLESRLIKKHQPRFNRALRRYRNRPFIRLETTETFPRLSWTAYLQDDGAEYFGPLGGRKQAELVVELIDRFFRLRPCDDDTFARGHRCLYADMDRCDAPCEGGEAAEHYAEEVERVRAFLMGHDRSVLERLEAAMRAAAVELRFEEARQYRDWMRQLQPLLDKQECLAAPVLQRNAVVVLPDARDGATQLYFVRFGRHVGTATLGDAPDPEALRHQLADHFDPEAPRPERYFKQEIDEIRVLAHWLYVYRDSTDVVLWQGEAPEAFLDRILARVRKAAA